MLFLGNVEDLFGDNRGCVFHARLRLRIFSFYGGIGMAVSTLQKWREQAGLTQAQVADYLGVERTSISCYERGRSQPNAQAILTLCQLYAVPEREMLWALADLAEKTKNNT